MITLGSGNYIQDVKSGIITYCQGMDMFKIAKILATRRFKKKVEVVIDNDKLTSLSVQRCEACLFGFVRKCLAYLNK